VVVQSDLLNNHHPSTIVCPLTTRIHPQSDILRVHLRRGEAGLNEKSDIMVDQLRAIDNRRFAKRLGAIGKATQKKLAENIQIILT
jgi:mRNA interferase MazF